MDPLSIAAIGFSVLGAGSKIIGGIEGGEAQQKAIAAQQRSEEIRYQAMKIDADRKRRQIIRQSIIARSQALTTETAQGAQHGSGLPGAYGQIAGESGWNLQGINQQEKLGSDLFAANKELLAAKSDQASAETISNIGTGLSSLGGSLVNNVDRFDRLFGQPTFGSKGGANSGVSNFNSGPLFGGND